MTKIVATISPTTPISENIDIVRINGAFGTFDEILEIIQKAREIGEKKIIIDLPMGRTKHRTSTFSDEALLKFCLEKVDRSIEFLHNKLAGDNEKLGYMALSGNKTLSGNKRGNFFSWKI